MSKKYIDLFSKETTDLTLRFDAAIISKDYETLSSLIDKAIELIKTETSASQARLYYSLATTYSDFAKFKGFSEDESFKKQLYYFRKSFLWIYRNDTGGAVQTCTFPLVSLDEIIISCCPLEIKIVILVRLSFPGTRYIRIKWHNIGTVLLLKRK